MGIVSSGPCVLFGIINSGFFGFAYSLFFLLRARIPLNAANPPNSPGLPPPRPPILTPPALVFCFSSVKSY